MKNSKYSLLYPIENAEYKTVSLVAMHDIGLDQICEQLSKVENEKSFIMNVLSKMYSDPYVTEYRLEIFDDIIHNKKMRDDMMEILNRINFIKDYGGFNHKYDEHDNIWGLMHRLDEINDYIKCVDALNACLDDQKINSEGLIGLKKYVEEIYNDNGFAELKKDISKLKKETSELKSITVGINLNECFEANGIGLISVNSKYFTKSGALSNFCDHLSSKDRINPDTEWKENYKFHPFNANDSGLNIDPLHGIGVVNKLQSDIKAGVVSVADGDQTRSITSYTNGAVDHMISGMVKKLKDILNKYVFITITNMTDLIPELMYYIRWAEYIEKLKGKGAVFNKPVIHKKQDKGENESGYFMKARGIYNIKLVAFETEESESIVTNNLDFDDDHRVYILTGANRGGKTTITQSIGQLFVLAQGGIYIPGDEFEFSPVDCVYTHFPADEDKTLDLGRLGEECKRFREIYSEAGSKSLLLLNETFSTTSFEEGYYIAKDSVRAILNKGVRTIYNTHMHKLAFDIEDMNNEDTSGKAYSLVVHNEGEKRSYKVEIAQPSGKSYAGDIAKKYGVTYDILVGKNK